jgi:thioredoxin 1
VEELAKDLDGKLAVGKVDVDSNPKIAEKYGIQSIPTLLIFKKGELAKTVVGYVPKPEIVKALADAVVS